ncbi:MAG TPA: sigma-70 family RNA polymerase sigma factor, partial [Candidatus Limivicinus faecipullorum]|nr:sigma-70 family RNA polymerase sigma factor [Candidatus Limivicinus faecipullorum]
MREERWTEMFTEEEFEAAAQRYMDGIFRLALNYMGSFAEAEDVTQNVLIRLYRTKKSFESSEHLRYWLVRVTINESKRMLLSPWRRTESLELLEDCVSLPEEKNQELFQTVMSLPEKYRVPLYLYYYEGYSTKELAGLLK